MELQIQEQLNQGIAFMSAEKYADAAGLFQSVLSADPANLDAALHLGNAYVSMDRYDDALAVFKAALMHHGNNGRLLYSIGGIHMLKNDIPQGIRFYHKAQAAGYQTVEMHLVLAGAFMDSGDHIQAIRSISRAIALQPLRADLYIRKSALQMRYKLYDEALETLEEYRELNPDAYETYSQAVQIHCSRKDFAEARKIADLGIARFPEDPGMMLLVLQVMVESGQYSEAVDYADALLKKAEPGKIFYRATMYKATACAMAGNMDAVISTLENYGQLSSESGALYMLMNTYLMKKDYAGVKRTASMLEALEPEPAMQAAAIYSKANAVEHLEGIQTARELYGQILPKLRRLSLKAPQNYEIYIYRILAHTSREEYAAALELAEYLEKAYPELPDGPLYQYHIYTRSKDMQKAALAREAALQKAPNLKLPPIG